MHKAQWQQQYAMNCSAQAAEHPACEMEHTMQILPDQFCGSLVMKGLYLSKHQPTGLEEKKSCTGAYESPVTYFWYQGQKSPNPDYLIS